MKYITYLNSGKQSIGCILSDSLEIIDIPSIPTQKFPNNMIDFINNFEFNNSEFKKILKNNKLPVKKINYSDIVSPISRATSFRDFYAFRQHVESGRKNRGLKMIPEYDQIPVFYFSNHNAITGPGDICVQKKHLDKLDFELEIGIIISKHGRNIKYKDAYKYVAGFTIMNDWSARALQFQEMKLNLGPSKGKDFATSIGPYLVTMDELEDRLIGKQCDMLYNLEMKAYLNDRMISIDNFKNITWKFPDMIERASYGVDIYPGDLIGSGTCATGCLLELNLSNNKDEWLSVGDTIRLDIDKLGSLKNTIIFKK
jgi:fumarylacetoacetate (FAA) hydrolase